jgi:hypothetical protein
MSRGRIALLVAMATLAVPSVASAGVLWDGAQFTSRHTLCGWLSARGARCDVWGVRHPYAWQRLSQASPRQEHSRLSFIPVAAKRPTRAIELGIVGFATLLLVLSCAPVPMTVRFSARDLGSARVTAGAAGTSALAGMIFARFFG